MDVSHDELGGCLRAWRDRLPPAEAGVPAAPSRRVPGLRREEVAQLAGVSLDYLSRLEQGRATNPSPSVVASLARALRLSDDERGHLFRLAGHREPGTGTINRHISPSIQRLLDRLAGVPVVVFDAAGSVVAANPLASALNGDWSSASGHDRNIAWRFFTGGASRLVRTPQERAQAEEEVVADLHDALGRYPADEQLATLIEDLRTASARFAELWASHPVAQRRQSRKTFRHPQVGEITVDCDVLHVQDSDLRIIVYSAAPGSADAQALELLGAIGLQRFAAG
ncbi:MAG TPA: helix-turn-helix transcriptional regulator, partial [Thermoleophilaceae bacterium]|nr:helix-turn-helix transcriptional regulator [Thermoleophilaceae bacterium]